MTTPLGRLAHEALERAHPGFLGRRGGAIREAEESLASLRDQAVLSADPGAGWVAEVALAASRAAEPHAASRLELLRHAFRTLEDASAASAGYLVGVASSLRDPLDAQECPKPVRDEVVRAVLRETARVSAREGLPEAGYLDMLAGLAGLVEEPGYALNMATRAGMADLGDVSRPAWLATVGSGLADAERTGPTPEARRILDETAARVARVAEERKDPAVPAWFARVDRWKALPVGDSTRFWLDRVGLRMIGDEIPPAPESGLVLAYRMRQHVRAPEERRVLLDQALAEAREATYPAGDRAGRWLDFLERSQGRMREAALAALAEGKPATPDAVAFDVRLSLKEAPTGASELVEALFDLQSPSTPREAAITGLKVADLAEDPLVQDVLLRRTLARAEAIDPTIPEAKLPLGSPSLVRFAVRSLAGEGEELDRLLVERAAPPRADAPPPISEEPDWVQIGSIRVPRRSSDNS